MSTDPNGQAAVRRRLIYTGRVQGVGFRYTAYSLARRYPLIGYVKNLPDGRVELVVQGAQGELVAFLDELGARFRDHVESTSTEAQHADPSLVSFEVRY